MRKRVIEKANAFAEENDYLIEVLSQDIHPMGILGDFASFTYTFRLVSEPSEINLDAPDQIITTREEAIRELKELKELLDLGILNQEEYDVKAKPLKNIILDN
jgi:hypothetical protein